MKNKIKILNISIAAALIFSILLSFVTFEAHCDDLRENVFRLHIIANSDSPEDQELKLLVRDAVLKDSEPLFAGCDSLSAAKAITKENLEKIKKTAEKTIAEQGYDYVVRIAVGQSFFDTRVYEDFVLPAGNYDALKIEIGRAEGKNWWCVLFPSICIGSAGKLSDTAREDSAAVAANPSKYTVRFKIVEWYEIIKSKIF